MNKSEQNGVVPEDSEYSILAGNICINCGDKILTQIFLNTGYCCENCRKGRPKNRG